MGIIRFILALSVALWHLPGQPFTLVYAAPAVLGFFIISGFYMAMVLTEKYRDARSFYVARFLRLYPAYAAMALVMIAWSALHHSPTVFTAHLPGVSAVKHGVLIVLNIVVAGQDVFEFSRNALGNGTFLNGSFMLVGQAWSLSSELFFYCLAPFVVRCPRRTAALLVAALAVRAILLGVIGLPWFWGYWFFPGAVCMFLIGSLAYHVHSRIKAPAWFAPALAAAWLGWLIYAVATYGIMLAAGPAASIDGPLFWVAYVGFAASVPLIFQWSKNNRLDRAVGELSYPLYLVHGLVQPIVIYELHTLIGPVPVMLFAVAASVLAAIAMRLAVEVPFDRVRRARGAVRGTRSKPGRPVAALD